MGVLVAISIPIFTSQLEKSREAVDLANIRSTYAEVVSDVLTGELKDDGDTATVLGDKTATLAGTASSYTVTVSDFPIAQRQDKWISTDRKVAGVTLDENINPASTMTLTFTFDTTGCISITLT